MLEEMQPVGPCDDRTRHQDRHDQQEHSAADPGAGTAPSETKPALEPVEQFVQQKQLQQTSQAALSILHGTSSMDTVRNRLV
jgi:hypothetical protein